MLVASTGKSTFPVQSVNSNVVKKTVFVVEDHPAQQKMLQVHLEEMLGNYSVRIFPSPVEMFASLKEKPFVIVLDHFFPGDKTGFDALVTLKKKHPSLPVIYHTSATDEAIRTKAMELGADQFILKDGASLVRLRTALDLISEQASKKGFFQRLFGK